MVVVGNFYVELYVQQQNYQPAKRSQAKPTNPATRAQPSSSRISSYIGERGIHVHCSMGFCLASSKSSGLTTWLGGFDGIRMVAVTMVNHGKHDGLYCLMMVNIRKMIVYH